MPNNASTPQNIDGDDDLDLFEDPDDQDTQPLPDLDFGELVDELRDGWPSINSDQ